MNKILYKKQFFVRMANYNKFGFMVLAVTLFDSEVVVGNSIFYQENGIIKPLNLLFVEMFRRKVLHFVKGYSCALFFEVPTNNSLTFNRKNYLYVRMNNEEIKAFFESKIQAIKELSTCRPLLIREQVELRFLQRIQAAETLESLQSIENEVINLATDETLKVQLAKCVEEKKKFY